MVGNFFKQSYVYKEGDYAPENYLLDKYPENGKYSSKLTKKKVTDEVPGTAYGIEKPADEEIITKMIFDGTTEEENYLKSYWLASPGVGTISNLAASFGIGGVSANEASNGASVAFLSTGLFMSTQLAVRPVVSLSSNVTVKKIKKINGIEVERRV